MTDFDYSDELMQLRRLENAVAFSQCPDGMPVDLVKDIYSIFDTAGTIATSEDHDTPENFAIAVMACLKTILRFRPADDKAAQWYKDQGVDF